MNQLINYSDLKRKKIKLLKLFQLSKFLSERFERKKSALEIRGQLPCSKDKICPNNCLNDQMVNQFEQKNETMKQRMLVAVIQNEFFNETISLLNDKSLSEY